jgi:hypothetical protein
MTRVAAGFAILLCTFSLLAGCAHTAYVRGVAGAEGLEPPRPGASICVALAPEGPESSLDEEITEKIGLLLVHRGYTLTHSSNADYFLFFEFECKSLMTRVRLEPLGGVRTGIHTAHQEGPFDLTLSLRLVETGLYHEKGLEEFVWVGGAVLSEVPTESPKFVDLLLIAAMKQFPKDTGTTLKTKIGLYDADAKSLRR